MTAAQQPAGIVGTLRQDADGMRQYVSGMEADIQRLESELQLLRERKERTERQIVECRAAANILEHQGFRVWRDDAGIINLVVDPETVPA